MKRNIFKIYILLYNMTLVSSCRDVIQYTRISIEPHQMSNDILTNMKIKLKNKLEKKCNRNGFIDEIYRIIDFSDGYMPPENLNGAAIFEVSFHCRLCIPIENTIIIGLIRILNSELIIAINGPIIIFITKENINLDVWNIGEHYEHKQSKTKLASNDYIKIQILNKRINQNDSQIKAIGLLYDMATTEEVEQYFAHTSEKNYIED